MVVGVIQDGKTDILLIVKNFVMQILFELMGEKIKEGYVIRPEHYAHENVTIYSIVKHETETIRSVYQLNAHESEVKVIEQIPIN